MLEQIMHSIQMAMEEQPLVEIKIQDKDDIMNMVYEFISLYMRDFLLTMQKPNFHTELFESALEHLITNFENIYNEEFEEELRSDIQRACSLYFSNAVPRRSYKKTFEKPRINKEKIQKVVEFLRSVPQNEQRTPAWYQDRWNMISASAAWKALSSDAHKNSLIFEKCTPINTDKFSSVNVNSPFHWGQKYEPLSIIIYEDKYNTTVEDFGCIPHREFKNIGASPDGINTDSNSTRFGRMVEVKNRFSESVPITGNPKEEYWIQMQLQMNVCELNECDFLETRFKEYPTSQEFYQDGNGFEKTVDGKMKGIYIYFQKNGYPHYEYPPLHQTKEEFEKWEEDIIGKKTGEGYEWIKNNYWYLDKYSCVLVFRNKPWFNLAVAKINAVWDIIIKERVTGFEHRAPTKRVRKISETKSKCLIQTKHLKVI